MARKNRKGNRGVSSTRVVTALTASQSWDRQLSTHKDRCVVTDRVLLTNIISATGGLSGSAQFLSPLIVAAGAVTAGLFGNRIADLSACFLRYRIRKLLACYRPVCGTTTSGLIGLGFIDDAVPSPTTTPTSTLAIDELRCSHVDSVYREIEVPWSPIDPKTWYYVDPAAALDQADARLQYPGSIVYSLESGPGGSTTYGRVQIYYTIEFEGATATSSVNG